MRFFSIWTALITALFLSSASMAYAQEERDIGADPLDTTPQALFGNFRLEYRPVTAATLGAGNATLELNVTHSNYWVVAGYPPDYYLATLFDAEITEWSFNLDYGVTDVWDIGVRMRVMSVQGGILDGYIEGFHRLFNFDNASRDEWPRNIVAFYDTRMGFSQFSDGNFLNDVVLENRVRIAKYLQIINQIRFPVDSPFGGFGGMLAGQVDGRWRDFGLTIGLGFSVHEDRDFFFYHTKPVVAFLFIGLSGRLEPNFSISCGFHFASNTAGDETISGEPLYFVNQLVAEIHTGFRWRVTNDFTVQFAIIENFTVSTAADIGFNLSIEVFGPR